jgi:hypothetical protein
VGIEPLKRGIGLYISKLSSRHYSELRHHLDDFAFLSAPDVDGCFSELNSSIQDLVLCSF